MYLKTDSICNEYDFIEENGQMKELTVTITLEEYRYLVSEISTADKTVNSYQKEIERLLKENENYKALLLAKFPDIKSKMIEIIECLGKDIASSIQSEVQENDG